MSRRLALTAAGCAFTSPETKLSGFPIWGEKRVFFCLSYIGITFPDVTASQVGCFGFFLLLADLQEGISLGVISSSQEKEPVGSCYTLLL